MSLAALSEHDRSRWHAVAAAARPRIETRLFIDGRFVDAVRGGRFISVNPADGEPLAEMSAATEADVDRRRRGREEGVPLGRVVAYRAAAADGSALPVRRPDRSQR